MKIIKAIFILLMLQSQASTAQKYTFVNWSSSIADFGSKSSDHYTLCVSQVISDSPSFMHSVGLRYMYYKRPSYMDSSNEIFLLGDLMTKSLNVNYQVKSKLYKRLFFTVNVEGGFVALDENFNYWVNNDFTPYEVIYTDEWKDTYKLNIGYALETGFEYFIVRNNNYFISANVSFQLMDRLKDFKFDEREGEFNRYEGDNRIKEPALKTQLPRDYFWLGGLTLGYNFR